MPSSSVLVLRETLLGALKARLEDPKVCSLHASDFHTACDQLGLRFGTKVRREREREREKQQVLHTHSCIVEN